MPPLGVSNPTAARPSFAPPETTLYTLTITDERGCRYADTLRIIVWPRLHVPSAFSPNGDGVNDVWEPVNLSKYPNAECRIYNRWGELVYEGRSATPFFDGSLRGEPLPEGVYTYHIRLNVREAERHGILTLIR